MSQALSEFLANLALPQALLDLEATFSDPPPPDKRQLAEALRYGAIVLMVACFENYFKVVVEEQIDRLNADSHLLLEKLPEAMRLRNLEGLFEAAKKLKKASREQAYLQGVEKIHKNKLDAEAFSILAQSNPNSDKIADLCRALGINSIFEKLVTHFRDQDIMTGALLAEKLDEIINKRHTVAHTGKALNLSREDLKKHLGFLKKFAEAYDQCLDKHIQDILQRINLA
jgi:hypothetical protein